MAHKRSPIVTRMAMKEIPPLHSAAKGKKGYTIEEILDAGSLSLGHSVSEIVYDERRGPPRGKTVSTGPQSGISRAALSVGRRPSRQHREMRLLR